MLATSSSDLALVVAGPSQQAEHKGQVRPPPRLLFHSPHSPPVLTPSCPSIVYFWEMITLTHDICSSSKFPI